MSGPPQRSDALQAHLALLPPVRVVYTDLDGTLLGPGGSLLVDADGRPDVAAAGALVDAARAGIAVVAVSGRRAATLAHDARLMGLAGAIGEVGTVIIRDGVQHIRWGICPPGLAATPREALAAAGALTALLAAFPHDLRPYEPWDEGRVGGFLLHGRVDVAAADAVLEAAGTGWAQLRDNGRSGGWPGRTVHAYHLVARGVGKAAAVAADLTERGLEAAEALAVGDSAEDATLADVVGTYVEVGNGVGAAAQGGNRFGVAGRHGAGVAQAVAAAIRATARD